MAISTVSSASSSSSSVPVVVDAPADGGDDVDNEDVDLTVLSIVVTPPPIVPGGGARLPARIRPIGVDAAAEDEGMESYTTRLSLVLTTNQGREKPPWAAAMEEFGSITVNNHGSSTA